MAHKYANTPVIVMGGELNDVREAAEGYVYSYADRYLHLLTYPGTAFVMLTRHSTSWPGIKRNDLLLIPITCSRPAAFGPFTDCRKQNDRPLAYVTFRIVGPGQLNPPKPVDFSKTRIGAIFVFHDPRNWALDGKQLPGAFPCSNHGDISPSCLRPDPNWWARWWTQCPAGSAGESCGAGFLQSGPGMEIRL